MIQKSKIIQETGTGTITIAAPGVNKYNMITSLDVESSGAATVTVTSSSTIWQHGITADESFFKSWDEEVPLRGVENASVVITVSGGAYTINVRGYVTP